ncbi:unnamed protein product [Adineta ricciae]|uniref:Pecanex-like protein n=1 Tax=Adineta ricciae TaxID=249248 RepID=A0A813UB92_ADIRI|nr:unnamed protein product [Adineta ricciae]
MTGFCLDILLHGIIPAVTGGFYYDRYTTQLANTVHIYLWICFMTLPLLLYLFVPVNLLSYYVYPLFVAILFAVVKFVNYRLHKFFDLAVRCEDTNEESKSLSTTNNNNNNIDIEEEPKLNNHCITTDVPPSETQPLWIDSLYGSNNSNLPSIYDESYARIRRSNATTTNDCHHSSMLTTTKQKSNDQIDEITKYSLTDVILQSSNIQDTCVSDSRLCEKHEQQQTKRTHPNQKFMRRVQSESNMSANQNDMEQSDHTLQSSSMTDQRLNKKSKSLAENLYRHHSVNQQENISGEPKMKEEIVEHKSEVRPCSTDDLPIDDWRPILQILENVFADEDEPSELPACQPDSLEPLLPNKRTRSHEQRQSSKSNEQSSENQDDGTIPSRFRRTHSNQGGRRRRTSRRTTSVEQRPSQYNAECNSNHHHLSPSCRRKYMCLLRDPSFDEQVSNYDSLRDETSLRDDSLTTTPSEESSQLLARTTDRPRWIPIYRQSQYDQDSLSQIIDEVEWHNETSPGTVHYFRDETGKLFSYVFGDTSCQARMESSDPKPLSDNITRSISDETEATGEQMPREQQITPPQTPITTVEQNHEPCSFFGRRRRHRHRHHHQSHRSRRYEIASTSGRPVIINDETHRQISNSVETTPQDQQLQQREHQTRIKHRSIKGQTYRLKLFRKSFIVPFDRLWLLTVFDRDRSITECILCIFLAIIVSIVGIHVLHNDVYYDLEILLYCCVIAASQYSLLKSCQPDVNTPVHGFNRHTAISRAIYFCLFSSSLLVISKLKIYPWHLNLFGITFSNLLVCNTIYNFLSIVLLCLPLLFLFGLLPQYSTFLLCILENFDMHLFGGTAMINIPGALYSFLLSIVTWICLSIIGYYGLMIETSKESMQSIVFSIYCGLTVSICYKLSRGSSNPTILWNVIKHDLFKMKRTETTHDEIQDPLPEQLKTTVKQRLQSDILLCFLIFILVFAAHASTTFTSLQPILNYIICSLVVLLGVFFHYILPQLRKQSPWLLFSEPLIKQADYSLFEPTEATEVLFIEKFFVWIVFLEKNILLPCTFLGALSHSAPTVIKNFGLLPSILILTLCSMKMLRIGYCNSARHFLYVLLTSMMTYIMTSNRSETFLLNYFILSILTEKLIDFKEKLNFIFIYCAPWQISWGSAFHAIAQPFCIPHSAILIVQCLASSLFNSPLMPLLGSAAFISSYPRPIKFWEKNYNTKRIDNTNVQLQAQINEFHCGLDDNNLNAIFYEHLTRVLQTSLCGEIQLGRLGKVNTGDFFILTSDSLNCMIHLIEIGNGFVTFQLRGLEFKGTYCQQREVEAITEDIDKNRGLCCCEAGRFPHMLSLNAAFTQRWLAWEVICLKFVVDGYSIKENKFNETVVGYDLRKRLISLMIKAVIFYAVRSDQLTQWLENEQIRQAMSAFTDSDQVDVDPSFTTLFDDDFKAGAGGVTKKTFTFVYGTWIHLCNHKRSTPLPSTQEDDLITFCFILSLLARRTLFSSLPSNHTALLEIYHENFVHGFYSLFKGDFRLAPKDEWAFADMSLLKNVVAQGVRMSLKLNQDSFLEMSEYLDNEKLYDDIAQNDVNLVITHEASPEWRNAILTNKSSLLALRRALVESMDEYRIVMLDRRHLSFRIVKVSKECVRGFWASQQHELIFLRNRNPERGSIQNAKQVLRNMINSSSDQPIGYPIFVSPLITSYSSTSQPLKDILGGELAWDLIRRKLSAFFQRAHTFFLSHCVGNASGTSEVIQLAERRTVPSQGSHIRQSSLSTPVTSTLPDQGHLSSTQANLSTNLNLDNNKKSLQTTEQQTSMLIKRTSDTLMPTTTNNDEQFRRRSSLSSELNTNDRSSRKALNTMTTSVSTTNSSNKDVSTSSNTQINKAVVTYSTNGNSSEKVVIIDTTAIYDSINLGRRIDVIWPNEQMRLNGGRNVWSGWTPTVGMTGLVVHRWIPRHRDARQRSHIDKCILLVHIDKYDKFVPIAEHGVRFIGESTYL